MQMYGALTKTLNTGMRMVMDAHGMSAMRINVAIMMMRTSRPIPCAVHAQDKVI